MTTGSNQAAAVTAFNRFGLGARPGDLNGAAGDPRGLLLEELWSANVALIGGGALRSGPMALQDFYLEQQQIRFERARMAAIAPASAKSDERAMTQAPQAMTQAPQAMTQAPQA